MWPLSFNQPVKRRRKSKKPIKKHTLKIRYYSDGDGRYCLKVNGKFYADFLIAHLLKTSVDIWKPMLLDTYNAIPGFTKYGSQKYMFTTLRDAKNAINYLRSLLVMNKIGE